MRAGSLWTGTDHVFATESGGLLSPDTVTQLMPKLVKAAGLPHARLHSLRHLHATTLLLAGCRCTWSPIGSATLTLR